MGDLTNNLSRAEFACPCIKPECNRTPVDFELVHAIQHCADHHVELAFLEGKEIERVAIHINSGYRCKEYDREMKIRNGYDFHPTKKLSEHIYGIAADHRFEYVMPNGSREVIHDDLIADHYEALYIGRCGIGRYKGRTHLDFRDGHSARWDKR